MTNNDYLNIKQLTSIIKESLPKNNLKLIAEVRQPKESRGHIYLNLKDEDGVINGTIWKFNVTEDIKKLKDGDKITVSGKLDFYNGNGKLQLIINKLLNFEGEGELNRLYNEMKLNFEKKGYFLNTKKLKVGSYIKKILILSSKNGDAIKDFYHCIENNNLNLDDYFINVSVQGNDCPNSICNILNDKDIYENNYDLIIITRGGGSFEDLFGFCQKELIESVSSCKIPILSAVGHKQDTTLLDYVADYVAPTPSLAAQFIVDYNKKYIDNLIYIQNKMKEELSNTFHNELSKISIIERKLIEMKSIYVNYLFKIKNDLIIEINNNILFLDKLENKYQFSNKIRLYNDNKELTDYKSIISTLKLKGNLQVCIEDKIIDLQKYLKYTN